MDVASFGVACRGSSTVPVDLGVVGDSSTTTDTGNDADTGTRGATTASATKTNAPTTTAISRGYQAREIGDRDSGCTGSSAPRP
jgi:hypothetical protein